MRKSFDTEFMAKVALEAIREEKTIAGLSHRMKFILEFPTKRSEEKESATGGGNCGVCRKSPYGILPLPFCALYYRCINASKNVTIQCISK